MAGIYLARNLTILTPLRNQEAVRRYWIAILSAMVAVLLRWILDPVLGHVAFYITIYIAVAFCAVVCGPGPAVLAAVLGFIGVFYWFVDPRQNLLSIRSSQIHAVIGCFLVCAVLILLGHANRTKQLRLNDTVVALTNEAHERQRAEEELQEAHDELERRVIGRTAELSDALARLKSEAAVREHTEAQLRRLSLRLMTLQDEERRRIARELHDTTGQTLAAMKMSIALIRQADASSPRMKSLVDDLETLTDEALQEVRTTSYLLHPPLLDEAGIASTVGWFVEGFAKRSGIEMKCDISQRMERPPRHCELVLFRVLQESLTNVHRHSGASAATVRLSQENSRFQLEVTDNGKGISPEDLRRFETSGNNAGVGIAGMRERVRELGGEIQIKPLLPGTSVRVELPTGRLTQPADAAQAILASPS
jgi:signal transduction histidine kinase